MRATVLRLVSVVGLACLPAAIGFAAARGTDPDWPCQQRLVPTLSAALFWSGPDVEGLGDWRREPQVAELVGKISPRKVAAKEGEALIAAFTSSLQGDRTRMVTLAFLGLLEETNRQRAELIERIKTLARRQRELAEIASRAGDELRTIPEDAAGEAAERRQDLELRRRYLTKAFEEGQRTIPYVCEIPVQLEARLGAYARALQDALS